VKGQLNKTINQPTRNKNQIPSTALRKNDYERLMAVPVDIKLVLANAKMEHDQVFTSSLD
jgi:flagellar motor switch/type III secretory pathway protein FliN